MLGIHGVGRDAGRRTTWPTSPASCPCRAPGPRWAARRQPRLGLAEAPGVGAGRLRTAARGPPPPHGRPLGSGRTTVAAFDLTFSAPKSASVLFALGGEDTARRVVAAHERSGGRRTGVPGASRRHGEPAIGPNGSSSRPPGSSPGGSPTASTATAIRTCTAMS